MLRVRFSKNLRVLMEAKYDGNISRMARDFEMDINAIRHWLYRNSLPSASALAVLTDKTQCCVSSMLLEDWEVRPVYLPPLEEDLEKYRVEKVEPQPSEAHIS